MRNAVKDPAGRIAIVALQTCARLALLERRAPNVEDFAEDFIDAIRIELMTAELAALRLPHRDRDARAKQIVKELERIPYLMTHCDIRLTAEETPEGRIAAACRILVDEMRRRVVPTYPDIADFREHLRPFIQREILLAELDEARRPAVTRGERIREMISALAALHAERDK